MFPRLTAVERLPEGRSDPAGNAHQQIIKTWSPSGTRPERRQYHNENGKPSPVCRKKACLKPPLPGICLGRLSLFLRRGRLGWSETKTLVLSFEHPEILHVPGAEELAKLRDDSV